MKYLRLTAILILLTGILSACSLKKNTAASRNYMAFITRYNIYFNGDEHYKQTLKEMETKYQDDYTRTVLMHPAEAKADEKAPQPTGDFTRSIEKAQKAIQLRSIKKRPKRKAGKGNDPEYKKWLKREEYNPFLHNAWMMMARSQYMNGDFLGAASTFFYISKHFTWLPDIVTEARLWQARSYCAIDWLFEAESILTRIKESELTNSTLTELYNYAWADYYIRSHRDAEAIPYLKATAAHAKGSQKYRLNFLLGQLYQATGQPELAYKAYGKVSSASGADYRSKFNARIKQSEVFAGSDITKEVKALKAMTRPGRNKEYLDQIYYAIGNLYLSRGDTVKAIENYQLAAAKSTRNGIDKALSQITLGKLYFKMGEYNKAQPCYAEAIPQLPETYPDYRLLKQQSDVLDELSVYAGNVELQDSLLDLSKLPPEEQRAVVDRIIADLIKKEKEEAENARREEYLADQAARGDGLTQMGGSSQAPSTFVMNTDNSWYFYNEATRNAGRTAFQKRWGSRRLEDDWRRRNKASFSFSDADELADGDDEQAPDSLANGADSGASPADREAKEHENDPHYPEYYLKQIPKTEQEKATANEVIRDGYYNMGLILKDQLNDFPAAEREFDMLMTRYPDNPYRLEVYNNLFLMYLRQGNTARAEQYRRLILAEFPDTKYAEALRGDDYATRLMASDSIQASLYDRAYTAYLDNNNTRVHDIYAEVRNDYPLSRIMPKFMFINALAYVTENNPEKFGEQLREIVDKYPDVDIAPLASDYLKLLNQGRKLNSTSTNLRGIVWSTRLGGDSASVSLSGEASEFVFDSLLTPQYFVFLFPTDVVKPNLLLYEVARFNFNNFTVSDFDLESMTFGQLGLLIVKSFNSVADANRYRSMLEQSTTFTMPDAVIPVAISEHNFNVLLSGRSFEEYFEAIGDDRLKRTHVEVLPPEEYPSAEEMYDTEGLDQIELTPEQPETESEEPYDIPVPTFGSPAQQPEPAPQPQPEPSPVPKPALKPKPAPKPVPPAPKPQPAPGPTPVPAPDIPEGSEGDDPLLD